MIMSWQAIEDELYAMLDSMSPPDYNYDWDIAHRVEREYSTPTTVISYPEGQPFESDISDRGGITSQERRSIRRVLIVCRVPSDMQTMDYEYLISKNDSALNKALEDIKKLLFGNVSLALCAQGVRDINYINATKHRMTNGATYFPFELVVSYDIDYVERR